MSTSSGLASKGEKQKVKFQSLDINSLYRVSRGEHLEKTQQKSTLVKHGMQCLGKVPSARRAPKNLPSMKSEHHGSDTATALVPQGGPGWGKQDTTTTSSTAATTSTTTTSPSQPSTVPLTPHQAAIALPVTTAIPTNKLPAAPGGGTPSSAPPQDNKSWSAVTSGGQDHHHPPPYQSAQFQHEFPSLSVTGGEGGSVRVPGAGGDPGLSLRPQTEGSWIQGGQGARGAPGQQLPPQLSVPAGQSQDSRFPQQYRGVMPSFMYKGNFPPNSTGGSPNMNMPTMNGRNRSDSRPLPRTAEEEVVHRPIIKEEDLSRMDEISKDVGWATHDDIDYNQKLTFSDDESSLPEKAPRKEPKPSSIQAKEHDKTENHISEGQKNWSGTRNTPLRNRSADEEELWVQQKRHQHSKEIDVAVQRAKQRREEEEKRFSESMKKGAAKKLAELDEKKLKRERDVNAKSQANIPLPDFQKDKDSKDKEIQRDKEMSKERDRDSRPKTPNERDSNDDKTPQMSFRHLTQIEAKNVVRSNKHSKVDSRERDGPGGGGSNFSKFDMPPRFLKQQRNNNMHPQMHYQHQHQFDNRWSMQSQATQNMAKPASINAPRKISENPDDHEEHARDRDYKRQSSDEIYRSSYRQDNQKPADGKDDRDYRYEYEHPRRDKEEDKWQREKEPSAEKHDYEPPIKQDDWHGERRDKYREEKGHDKYERPQRPDSRDSRTSRESRHSRDSARDSEPREYLWADHTYDTGYEEKRRDFIREDRDRRVVPGPITKERIEADLDMKNEKRKLTQLKRGQIIDKKISDVKRENKIQEKPEYDDDDNKSSNSGFKSWAETSSSNVDSEKKDAEKQKGDSKSSDGEVKKSDTETRDRDEKSGGSSGSGRNRNYLTGSSSKGWGSSSEYHRSGWSKRSSNRGGRSVGSTRGSSNLGESHGTDSEGSLDDHGHEIAKNQRSPKPPKKLDDEKNRDAKQDRSGLAEKKSQDNKRDSYVPRGEPSKHGRGGGNSFRNRGSIGKRIDGYGPPPSKSPFGNHDEKKVSSDETSSDMAPVEDKTKQSQQALSAGIIGSARKESSYSSNEKDRKLGDRPERNRTRKPNDGKRGKSRSKNENKKEEEAGGGSTSDNSDENNPKDGKGLKKTLISNKGSIGSGSNTSSSVSQPRHSNPPRLSSDKRSYRQTRNEENIPRQNSATSLRSQMQPKKEKTEENVLASAIADISLKNKEEMDASEEGEEKSIHGDSDGFQEVKSKKNFKEKPKSDEKSAVGKPKPDKEKVKERPKPTANVQLTQQQISNIPPLMSAPVNPPQVLPQQNKREQFDRPRNKLAPRFAKQRENNRLQKAQMQQHGLCDVNEMNKVNQSLNVYGMKDSGVVPPITNAWEKPLGSQLRGNIESDGMLGVGIEKGLERNSPSQTSSPGTDKDKTLLDGTTPPVNTIIFENTNFKSAPVSCNTRPDKPRSKLDEAGMDNSVMSGFNKPMVDLMNKADKQSESMQLPLSFKEDNMKLDFFDSDLSHLSDDKIGKNICLSRSMHGMTGANSTISTAESLNFKIASVKKVWENTPPDHGVGQDETAFGATFDPSGGLDPNSFSKPGDVSEDNHEVYSASPSQVASNSTTNVCKVKPTQQVSGNSGQTVLNSAVSQQMVAPGLMGNPLSPPPMQPVIGAGVGLGQPPQQFTTNQHLSFQASLTGSTQYNMPAIPSPPTVLYNSTQQLQQAQSAGLYGAFQIDQSGVLGGRTSSQYSQYPSHYGLGQTASAQYGTAQSMYLQAAQPPAGQGPPPPPPPDLYAGVGSYRLSATAGPFGQNQGVGNNTTVLISSTANSLMSASVKPSSQQMSAIGTKSGGVGQAYQQQSQQQQQQVYMTYDPTLSGNYLPSAGVIQRGPAGPVQNNVVPALQASSSFYSGSTGGQTGYFQQPGSSTLQSAQLQQPQGGYGLQGNVFGTHNQSHTNAGLQSFNSHFLSTPILAAALSAQQLSAQQQFRSNLQTQYMKGVGGQSMGDQSSRAQQLKSPGSQEMLSSVFNSGSQIPSPKSRQNCKQPLPQPSPTGKHNYNLYQGVGNQQAGNAQRYPTPIQRPVNFQQNMVPSQSSSNKHRSNQNNKAPPRQYYSNQGNSLTSQAEKHEDPKVVVDSVNSTISAGINSSSVVEKAANNTSTVAENSTVDPVKDKEAALND